MDCIRKKHVRYGNLTVAEIEVESRKRLIDYRNVKVKTLDFFLEIF